MTAARATVTTLVTASLTAARSRTGSAPAGAEVPMALRMAWPGSR